MFSYHGTNGQNQAPRYVQEMCARWRYQLDVREPQRLVEFARMQHRGRSPQSTIVLLKDVFCEIKQGLRLVSEIPRTQTGSFCNAQTVGLNMAPSQI